MTQTVIDSTDLKAVLTDAGVEPETPPETQTSETGKAPEAPKEAEQPALSDEELDTEGEDGLTPRQKQELSAKMQKAIGRKHRQLREAEEFAAAQYSERQLAEKRAENLERQLAQLQQQVAPPPTTPQKPKREDFQTDAEYIDAQIQYGIEEGIRKEAAKAEKAREEEARKASETAARARIAKALELVPDFREVTEKADMEVPTAIASYMQDSDLFAELGYHFAKHPEELLSLSKLPPHKQLVQLGKIEATLKPFGSAASVTASETSDGATPSKNGAKPPSDHGKAQEPGKAPSPARAAPVISPLNTGGMAVEKEPDKMNVREAIQAFAKTRKVDFSRRKRH